MKKQIALAVAWLAACAVQLSHAASVTATFSAVVTSSAGGSLPGVGSTIQGDVTYIDLPTSFELPDPSVCAPAIACTGYTFDTSPSHFSAKLGDSVITSSTVGMGLYINNLFVPGQEPLVVQVSLGAKVDGISYFLSLTGVPESSFSLTNPSDATAFLSQWRPGGEQFASFYVFDSSSQVQLSLQAQITGLSVTSVPEPTTAALFAIGLGGAALASRRRHLPMLGVASLNSYRGPVFA